MQEVCLHRPSCCSGSGMLIFVLHGACTATMGYEVCESTAIPSLMFLTRPSHSTPVFSHPILLLHWRRCPCHSFFNSGCGQQHGWRWQSPLVCKPRLLSRSARAIAIQTPSLSLSTQRTMCQMGQSEVSGQLQALQEPL